VRSSRISTSRGCITTSSTSSTCWIRVRKRMQSERQAREVRITVERAEIERTARSRQEAAPGDRCGKAECEGFGWTGRSRR